MVIQHNIPALNAYRQLGINNNNLSGNLEKLSSGYRINRAADDAAGLAISEKMRAQITGLNRAVLNAQDGASLIQTAEGALTEVHDMLNRMVELATQSANGTIQADDRQKIEAEVTALKGEIDRISEATNFNGIQLLDGSLGGSNVENIEINGLTPTSAGAAGTTVAATKTVTSMAALAVPVLEPGQKASYTYSLDDGTSATISFTMKGDDKTLVAADGTEYALQTAGAISADEIGKAVAAELQKDSNFNTKFSIATNATAGQIVFTAKEAGSHTPNISGGSQTVNNETDAFVFTEANVVKGLDESKGYTVTAFDGTNEDAATFSVNGQKFVVASTAALAEQVTAKDVNVIIAGTDAAGYASIAKSIADRTGLDVSNMTNIASPAANPSLVFKSEGPEGLTMQVGTSSADFDKITVKVDDMSSTGLGIDTISMASQEAASAALDKINFAIEKVSVNRGNLGALQNRLEHTMNNLNVTAENMTAAESRIRDVDMAKEMMDYTKNNVLSQAAQAMLAQANQQPQSVLQLLQ